MEVRLQPVSLSDADALARIRVASMQESLAQAGRFDPNGAHARFVATFDPDNCRAIVANGERVGLISVLTRPTHVFIEHLYVVPRFQNRGIGSTVLSAVCMSAEKRELPVVLGALQGSRANAFYLRFGFVRIGHQGVDLHYVRLTGATRRIRSRSTHLIARSPS